MRSLTKTATSADTATASASGWQTIKRIAPYLWPKGELWVKQRVVFALLLLFVSSSFAIEPALQDGYGTLAECLSCQYLFTNVFVLFFFFVLLFFIFFYIYFPKFINILVYSCSFIYLFFLLFRFFILT
jgi:hypothetical protein